MFWSNVSKARNMCRDTQPVISPNEMPGAIRSNILFDENRTELKHVEVSVSANAALLLVSMIRRSVFVVSIAASQNSLQIQRPVQVENRPELWLIYQNILYWPCSVFCALLAHYFYAS